MIEKNWSNKQRLQVHLLILSHPGGLARPRPHTIGIWFHLGPRTIVLDIMGIPRCISV